MLFFSGQFIWKAISWWVSSWAMIFPFTDDGLNSASCEITSFWYCFKKKFPQPNPWLIWCVHWSPWRSLLAKIWLLHRKAFRCLFLKKPKTMFVFFSLHSKVLHCVGQLHIINYIDICGLNVEKSGKVWKASIFFHLHKVSSFFRMFLSNFIVKADVLSIWGRRDFYQGPKCEMHKGLWEEGVKKITQFVEH